MTQKHELELRLVTSCDCSLLYEISSNLGRMKLFSKLVQLLNIKLLLNWREQDAMKNK